MPILSRMAATAGAASERKSGFVCKGKPGVAMPVSSSSPAQLGCSSNNHHHHHNTDHTAGTCRNGDGGSNGHSQEQVAFTSRCPHVILIGDLYMEDLDTCSLVALQQRKKNESESPAKDTGQEEEEEEEEDSDGEEDQSSKQIAKLNRKVSESVLYLTCDECDQRKNLWICLRQDCLYVGCGQSNLKHSTNHAQVSKT